MLRAAADATAIAQPFLQLLYYQVFSLNSAVPVEGLSGNTTEQYEILTADVSLSGHICAFPRKNWSG
jgi:hypothetical protein